MSAPMVEKWVEMRRASAALPGGGTITVVVEMRQ
jgi:hypothetical protein